MCCCGNWHANKALPISAHAGICFYKNSVQTKLFCADHWMFTRLCRSDDNRLLTSTVNTSNELNSCFPSQLILVAIALSLSGGV